MHKNKVMLRLLQIHVYVICFRSNSVKHHQCCRGTAGPLKPQFGSALRSVCDLVRESDIYSGKKSAASLQPNSQQTKEFKKREARWVLLFKFKGQICSCKNKINVHSRKKSMQIKSKKYDSFFVSLKA